MTNRRPVVFRSRWILPVTAPAVADGELLVDDRGRIAAVAPRGALELPEQVEVRELGDAILLPGLVNVHAHPELAMFRGALEDLPFRDWILRLVGAKRGLLGEADALAAARWTMAECTRSGITTLGATESSGAAVQALADAGLRGVVFQEVFGPDPAGAEASISQFRADLERLHGGASQLVQVGISPHAPYTVSDALYREAVEYAHVEGMPVAVHIAESRAERDLVTAGAGDFAPALNARGIPTPIRGRTPIEMLERLGVLEARALLIHCVDLDDEDIGRIAASGCSVAHCPIANARLGHGIAPVPRLRAAGVTVGLGTDSVGSNNRLDLLEEARFASMIQRAHLARPDVLPAEELLRMCTIDGARALGLDDRIGSLEPGKDADLCAVSLDTLQGVPSPDPHAALFHAARGSDVVLTAVAGRVLYEFGTWAAPPDRETRMRVEDAAVRIKSARR